MTPIFISYRRGDSKWAAKALFNHLSHYFGEEQIFMDIDTIEPGADFVQAIEDAVGSCRALVAVIGPDWLNITDEHGRRRLDRTSDYVRLEIASALKRDIRVIPALIDGASMPDAEEMPPDLSALARRNALEISEKRFENDGNELIRVIEKVVGVPAGAGTASWQEGSSAPGGAAPTFGGGPYVEVLGLPGEIALWSERGIYYIAGELFRDVFVVIVLTNQRLLILPNKKPAYKSGILLRPKIIYETLPLEVRHSELVSVATKPLYALVEGAPVVEASLRDGSIHRFHFSDGTARCVQNLQKIIAQRQ